MNTKLETTHAIGSRSNPRHDVGIRMTKLPVFDKNGEQIEGAFKEDWQLVSSSVLQPGERFWLKTSRPYPTYVEVLESRERSQDDIRDGIRRYSYQRMKRENTTRKSGDSGVTGGERFEAIERRQDEMIAQLAADRKAADERFEKLLATLAGNKK